MDKQEFIFPPDPLDDDDEDESTMTWCEFHELVKKKCGKYLKEHGETDMRGSIKFNPEKRRRFNQKDFDDYLGKKV